MPKVCQIFWLEPRSEEMFLQDTKIRYHFAPRLPNQCCQKYFWNLPLFSLKVAVWQIFFFANSRHFVDLSFFLATLCPLRAHCAFEISGGLACSTKRVIIIALIPITEIRDRDRPVIVWPNGDQRSQSLCPLCIWNFRRVNELHEKGHHHCIGQWKLCSQKCQTSWQNQAISAVQP